MSLKVLVTGAAGLLGSRIIQHLPPYSEVTATYHLAEPQITGDNIQAVQIDLTEAAATDQLLDRHHFDLIVNCAGATNVDRCEQEHDYALRRNVAVVKNLVNCAEKLRCRLIHVSSDYVFDGEAGPAAETDKPCPINFYGESKLMAEEVIDKSGVDATIIRVCSLYSVDPQSPRNILKSITESLNEGKPYLAADDLFSNPTEVDDLAQAVCQISKNSEHPSIIHLASPEYVTRYEFAQKVALALGLDQDLIKPVQQSQLTLPARRPKYAGLKSATAEKYLGRNLKTFSEVIQTHS